MIAALFATLAIVSGLTALNVWTYARPGWGFDWIVAMLVCVASLVMTVLTF